MNSRIFIILFYFLIFFSMQSFSDGRTDKAIFTERIQAIEDKCDSNNCGTEDLKELKEKSSALDELNEKFKFGVAIGFEHYKDGYITDTETLGDNRTVRVSASQDYKPSIWLETHYVWDRWGGTHSAPGFYIGARLLGPDSSIFEAFSFGPMWSFKRTRIGDTPPEGQIAESINIGLGPVWHKTNRLAFGITENEALSENFNDVQLDSRDEVSWMLMISAGF
ncbi:hypothetical protein [Marinimicrobium locisalis]|uniref:hypothetical protein n=1 Tax=Marinimicrobium locisalis TaxID=546022 RepID=UPI0032213A36